MKEFVCKTKILWGSGAVSALKELGAKRLMLVTDPFFEKNGTARGIAQQAQAEKVEIFSNVTPDPSVELAAEGTARVKEFMPDVLVALGGGSAMDCAKAMTYFSGLDVRLVAIPTTSGSGSEVTDFAILTHDGVKHPLVDDRLTPETDALAKDAFSPAFALLPASYAGRADVRLKIHMAATMAGMAFTQAGLGMCHAMSHALGGMFHVPHGRLNAILLPSVIGCNAYGAAERYAQIARAAGLGGSADTVAVRNLKNALIRLRKELGLPDTLAKAGVEPRLVWRNMGDIAKAALADPCCATNPVRVEDFMVRQVLEEVTGRV